MEITTNRLRHSLEVARLMRELALQKNWGEERSQEMFVLGYLHDIGYEFCETQIEHPTIGGKILKDQGYKYWREVSFHGLLTDNFSSDELDLLNTADMMIDSHGDNVGVQRRLEDIGERYGRLSTQYQDACALAKKLKLCEEQA